MQEPSLSARESERLAELHGMQLLDTEPEERFDRITRTALRLFGVPVALISLVDQDRQWFKSRQGWDIGDTSRRLAFSAHTILQDVAFVVEDAAADTRFADHPQVAGAPHIRFYAGWPLHGPSGNRIGTLDLLDCVPRSFRAADIETLRDLAGWAESELNSHMVRQAMLAAPCSESRLHTVVENVADAIITLDQYGKIASFNRAAQRIFGYTPAEVMGQNIKVLMPEIYHQAHDGYLKNFRDTGKTRIIGQDREVTGRRKSGELFPMELTVNEMWLQGKRGFAGIIRDITTRREAERVKNEFISTVSHELRTPLTSIRGSLGLLAGGMAGDLPERAKTLLDIANNNSERLVRLINDILDIEKIESGNMRFEMIKQRMLPLVEQALAATRGYATQFQVKLELMPDAADAEVVVDGDRIVQVIVNLLSNAVKFSPAGNSVQVRLTRLPNSIRLSVADRGPGIADEFRERIFQKFAQADASTTRQKGGTGLGLSISRAIVERHFGRIDFDSVPGTGAEFHVELSLAAPPLAHSVSRGRVLICEDDPDIAKLLGMMLAQADMASDIAPNARQARHMLQAGDYDAMTLDLALPDEDGISLLRWMRTQEKTHLLPVVVVSAYADEQRRKLTGGAVGIIDWIAKPIDEGRLLQALQNAMCRHDGVPNVLHVEDDLDLVRVTAALLEPSFALQRAATLAEARQKLASERFALILLDLQLPDGHGSELLTSLPPLNATTPIVVFSIEEANQFTVESVHAALVKSRTSNEQLLSILHRLIGGGGEER